MVDQFEIVAGEEGGWDVVAYEENGNYSVSNFASLAEAAFSLVTEYDDVDGDEAESVE